MRRWNGWGDEARDFPLTDAALGFLRERLGPGRPRADAPLATVASAVGPSRLELTGASTDAETRLRHARAQSFPDWVALRSGAIGRVPDAVAMPRSHDEVASLLRNARQRGAIVIPYGGGTSVTGHLAVPAGERPVLSLSLERMDSLLELDTDNWLARFGAGAPGPAVEAQLGERGYTLGHFPQSWELSTVGGWIAARSSGQQSLRYGRIEQLFHRGRLASFAGDWEVGGVPASAAGPDLREAVLGSEGRLGVVTEATLRIRPRPQRESFHAVFFPSWEQGVAAMRGLTQSEHGLSLLRLSNEIETETQLALAGHARLVGALEKYLRLRGAGPGKVMLLLGASGTAAEVRRAVDAALSLCRRHRGVHAGQRPGAGWVKNRFHSAYLRNSLWNAGYAVDTMETCLQWSGATAYMRAVESAARGVFQKHGERVHAYTHLSHAYRQGCSVYSTFVWPLAATPDQDLALWSDFKRAVSDTLVAHRGTISHQHGVGADHAPWLAAEKGPVGMGLLRAMARELDPEGLMNPAALLP